MDWTNVTIVLTWLTGFGSPALVMVLLSLVAENWAGWAKLPVLVKKWVPGILSVLIAVGASLLLKSTELLAQIQPWFQIIAASILAYIASQKTYQGSLKARYGSRWSKSLRGGTLQNTKYGNEVGG